MSHFPIFSEILMLPFSTIPSVIKDQILKKHQSVPACKFFDYKKNFRTQISAVLDLSYAWLAKFPLKIL